MYDTQRRDDLLVVVRRKGSTEGEIKSVRVQITDEEIQPGTEDKMSSMVSITEELGNQSTGAGETAPKLRTIDVLPEDPSLVPITHVATHNFLQLQFWGS